MGRFGGGLKALDEVRKALKDFRDKRGWGGSIRPASPDNFAKSIAIEAAELLEIFQWSEDDYKLDRVGAEMADIYIYLILLADCLGLDLNRLAVEKIAINDDRYPARDGQKMNFEPHLRPDCQLTIESVLKLLVEFRKKRDWEKTSTPANFAKSILIEAAELLEHFQWSNDGFDLDEVKYEIADVYSYILGLTAHLGLDLNQLALEKIAANQQLFPAPDND